MRNLLAALVLLTLSPLATAQDFYALHDQFQGVYVTSELPNWGFTADIQKGILFVAVFGYDETGDDAFLTFVSDKVGTDNPFSFAGQVFQTDDNGQTTTAVGTFTWNTIAVAGQPGALINVDSPFLEATNLILSRFGFVEDDPLDVMEGKTIGLLLAGSMPGSSTYATDFGNFIEFAQPRDAFSDGIAFLPGAGLTPDISAGFYFEPNEERYELIIVDGNDQVVYFWQVVSHTNLQGSAFTIVNGQQSATVGVIGVYFAELANPPVAKGSVDVEAIKAAYDQLKSRR